MVLHGTLRHTEGVKYVVACTALLLLAADSQMKARYQMVREQIEARGVRNREVLDAMRNTPRHQFVPSALQAHAYEDRPLPIGYGQTISQPYIVALMTEMLDVDREMKVLEIGTGSGYQAAVLSPLVRKLYTIEIVPELARRARETLERLGHRNVVVKHGDGYMGWVEAAPFDRILLTAAPPEIPPALVAQLKPGGKMVAPVGASERQELTVLEKRADGSVRVRTAVPVSFVPMVRGTKR